jgi:glycosyltransferase involved in cell wall biosynthesis
MLSRADDPVSSYAVTLLTHRLGFMPVVTVVVPTHNRSSLLRTTLRSLLAQRDVDLDIIVVDDGSTDSTSSVVAGFQDPRLRVIHNAEARGVSHARNRGVAEATGEWISFCDDDDVWAPDKLAQQLTAARRLGRDWAYCGVINIDGHLRPVSAPPVPSPDKVVADLPRYNAVSGGGSNVVVRRGLLTRAGQFDPVLRNTEDWEMWLRLSRLGLPAAAERRLVGYRLHATNASLDVNEILNGVRRIEQVHQVRVDRGRIHRWLAESCLRTGHRGQAVRHWAVAAGRGELTGVAADMWALLTRRLFPRSWPTLHRSEMSAWADEAREWLDALTEPDAGPVAR